MHDGPTRQAQRHAGARARCSCEVAGRAALERRQRAGDVVLHDQRRGRLADRAPARARGDRALHGDPAALGGPHRGRLARRSPTRSSARSTTGASQFPREWPYYLGWNAPALQRAGHDLLPAGRRQHAPVHQRAADPAVRAARQGAAVHRRLAAVPAARTRWSGRRGRRPRSGSSTRSPTSRSAASSAPAAASSTPDAPAPLGSLDDGAHRLRGVLPAAEPDAHGEALRLGGWVHGAPMIPHVWQRDPAKGYLGLGFREYSAKTVDVALEALAAGAGLAAELRRHRRRARGPVPAVRHRHGRGGRPGARGEVRRPAARTPTPRSSRQAYKDTATAETYMTQRRPPAAPRRSSTRRRSAATWSRPTGASRRTPTRSTCRASGCSSRTWRSSTTSASPTRATSQRQAEGREIWDAADPAATRIGRMTGLTLFTPIRPQWVWLLRIGFPSRGTLPFMRAPHPAVQLHPVRALDDRATGCRGEKLHYPYLFFESNFDGPWQHYIDAFAYVIPQRHPARRGGAGPASPARRRPSR